MTVPHLLPRKFLIAILALVYTGLSFGAATASGPAMARENAIHFRAELAQPATETRVVAAGTGWSCKGTRCVARKGPSRPVVTCTKLVREVGIITSFTSKGVPLSAEKLARCNGE